MMTAEDEKNVRRALFDRVSDTVLTEQWLHAVNDRLGLGVGHVFARTPSNREVHAAILDREPEHDAVPAIDPFRPDAPFIRDGRSERM